VFPGSRPDERYWSSRYLIVSCSPFEPGPRPSNSLEESVRMWQGCGRRKRSARRRREGWRIRATEKQHQARGSEQSEPITIYLAETHGGLLRNRGMQIVRSAAFYLATASVTTRAMLQFFSPRTTIPFERLWHRFSRANLFASILKACKLAPFCFTLQSTRRSATSCGKHRKIRQSIWSNSFFSFRGVSEVEVTEDRISVG